MLAHEGTHTYPARINIMYMLALNELVPMEQTVHAQAVMYTQYSDTQHLRIYSMAALCACEWRTIKHNTIYLTSVYTSIIFYFLLPW